jgi:hypothetical protein
MKIISTLKRLSQILVLSLTFFALRGTSWTDDAGSAWDAQPDIPGGVSWE